MKRMFLAIVPLLLAMKAGPADLTPTSAGGIEAVLGQAFAGDLPGGDVAMTTALFTNTGPMSCSVGFEFDPPTTQSIFLNGEEARFTDQVIASGGSGWVMIAAEGPAVQGSARIFVPDCPPGTIKTTASYSIFGADESVKEVFTLRPSGPDDWLRDGSCRVVTINQDPSGERGPSENLGVATSGVIPQFPGDADLELFLFDPTGNRIGDTVMELTADHQASFPIPDGIEGKLTVIFCVSAEDPSFLLDVTTVKVVQGVGGGQFQFDAPIFADGFESGDTSSWSDQLP